MRRGLAGRQHAAMPRDDPLLAVDHDPGRKAELADAARDLRGFRIPVPPRRAHVRDQSLDRAHDAARLAGCGPIVDLSLIPEPETRGVKQAMNGDLAYRLGVVRGQPSVTRVCPGSEAEIGCKTTQRLFLGETGTL